MSWAIALLLLAHGINARHHYWHDPSARPLHGRAVLEGQKDQCFAWSLEQSLARESFPFVSNIKSGGKVMNATMGKLFDYVCDSLVCPPPRVPDCYKDTTACGPDEFCQLQDQVEWGPWALGPGGETLAGYDANSCADLKKAGNEYLFQKQCGGYGHWIASYPVRGRCAKYRKEQQSCVVPFTYSQSGSLGSHYYAGENGRPLVRPLVCAPGLVCTGDVQPMPYTCVKQRPQNTCFQGPWWDSTAWCKSTNGGGLTLKELQMTVQTLLLTQPGDKYFPQATPFWLNPEAQAARDLIQKIVETLWPEVYRAKTTFPLYIPDPRKVTNDTNSPAWTKISNDVAVLIMQPNKIWSTIHTLIHNVKDPMSTQQVMASRSLVLWLRQHFLCTDCRGFWGNDVVNELGLPPQSSSREDHQLWWWRAHNMVSEHTAATLGGHPWVYDHMTNDEFAAYGKAKYNTNLLTCQNPWFLPYEDAVTQWTIV